MRRVNVSLFVLLGALVLLVAFGAEQATAQFATQPGYNAATAGGACNNSTQNFAWPDASGHVLQCVSSVWTAVTMPVSPGGSSGDVQFNNSGALGGSNNLFWNNSSSFLGIGTASPANALDVNGAVAVGSYAGIAAPSNSMIVSGPIGIGSTAPIASLDINGSLSLGSEFGNTLTTLNGAINSSVTTITVASTANYPSAGTISISGSSEVITYTGKTGTTFTGCTRGAYGTTAASHSNGATVYGMLLQIQPGNVGGLYSSALTVFNNESMIIGTPTLPYSGGNVGSLAVGTNVNISGGGFLAVGYNATASAIGGVAMGTSVTSNAFYSFAFGNNTTSAAEYEVVLGQYNKPTGSETNSWIGTTANPVFVIGIGTSGQSANALMVFETGQMLVNGGTTVTVPTGTASLNAMGVSTSSADASLNATNSSGTSLLYVRDDGNVGIGNTSPAYLLHVGSSSASGVVAEFQNSSGACTLQPGASGMITTCSSDARLKDDIHDTGDALAWIADMRVRDFTIKATGEPRTGVIAQEMLKTHPDMVRLGPDGFYGVEEPNLWKMVKALQQLKTENDELRAENDNLETAVDEGITELKAIRARIKESDEE